MTSPGHDELHWLAFRYATGEMTAEEEQDFERRLADDQLAREAVEQAVELSEAVRLAEVEAPRVYLLRPTPRVRSPAVWTTAAAALLLVIGAGTWLVNWGEFSSPADRAAGGANGSEAEAADQETSLALEWAALREHREGESPAAPFPTRGTDDTSWLDEYGEIGAENGSAAESVASLPEWLLTAVADETKSGKETP